MSLPFLPRISALDHRDVSLLLFSLLFWGVGAANLCSQRGGNYFAVSCIKHQVPRYMIAVAASPSGCYSALHSHI